MARDNFDISGLGSAMDQCRICSGFAATQFPPGLKSVAPKAGTRGAAGRCGIDRKSVV